MAAISLPCHLPRQTSPVGDVLGSLVCRYSSLMLMPLWRERGASRERVFSPSQLWSLNSRFRRSCPSSAARSTINTDEGVCTRTVYSVSHLLVDMGWVGLALIWVLHHLSHPPLPNSHQARQNWADSGIAKNESHPNSSQRGDGSHCIRIVYP